MSDAHATPAAALTVRARVLILAASAAILSAGSAGVSLFDRDEGWYAQITREMTCSGDWIVPTYLGKPNYFKPPLLYWSAAVSTRLLGWSEFALRLPGLVASAVGWTVLAAFTARHAGRRAGLLVAPIACTALGPQITGKLLLADGYLLLFVTLAMTRWIDQLGAPQRCRRRAAAIWAWAGAALVAKGPAALVVFVPFATGVALLDVPRHTPLAVRLRRAWPGPGWPLLVLIAAPWYAAAALRDPAGFWSGFVIESSVDRLHRAIEGHAGPPGFYLVASIGFLWPWIAFGPAAVADLWQRRLGEPAARRLLLWLVSSWIAFELIHTKLPHYLLIVVPPFLVATARCAADWSGQEGRRDAAWKALTVLFAASAVFWIGVASLGREWLQPWRPLAVAALAAATAVALAAGRSRIAGRRCAAAVVGLALMHQASGWLVLPALEPHRLSRNIAKQAASLAAPGQPVFALGFAEPTMFYYLDRPGGRLRLDGPAEAAGKPSAWFVLVAKESRLEAARTRLELDESTAVRLRGVNYGVWKEVVTPVTVWVGRARWRAP